MNQQVLSKRLASVGEYVLENARLADIGSDHAYLPVALVLQGKINFAIAGEVVKGPFESAQKQVAKNGLQKNIQVRLADGLAAVEKTDQITAVTICGMGGSLIRDILAAGVQQEKLNGTERLILQPNIGENILRGWLKEHEYQIVAETILEENHKTYEIIVAEKSATAVSYSPAEILLGPFLSQEKNPVFVKKWQRELSNRQRILKQLKAATSATPEKIAQFQAEIELIKTALKNQ
ncbi:tRNA (adenine(22)-N(1))-methyltransferase [Enterococcus sp. HY326]|uniref:tRNA (adenine(22)-N(1))-methyltransferase n=1 Tax=Enterococcus sp. HY326 TaxID=2971265 RepID=UPI002240109E|nr:tRNA (adenine(22)-N(1))-methyltransferase TrmK [Enterococcus sp. HY326]